MAEPIVLKNPLDPLGQRVSLNLAPDIGGALLGAVGFTPYSVAPVVGGVVGAGVGVVLERNLRRRASGWMGGLVGAVAGAVLGTMADGKGA